MRIVCSANTGFYCNLEEAYIAKSEMKVYSIINTIQLNYFYCKIAPVPYMSYFLFYFL